MAIGSAHGARAGAVWDALTTLVAVEGSAGAPHLTTLTAPRAPSRDMADAAHCLCLLHGRHPGVIEHAAGHASGDIARVWLADAASGFTAERDLLVRLISAAGPLPSTPGQAESEAAISGQRHALDMLAASDRAGCAIGAALALVLDWAAVRRVLDATGHRLGLTVPAPTLPVHAVAASVVTALAEAPAFQRALLFGASQTLAQHRALWHLLAARAEARVHA